MITAPDIQELLHQETQDKPIVSVFLDLSVNSDNKRTHGVFLSRQRTHFEHPALELNGKRRALEATLDEVERWLTDEFDESNRGAAIYLELGGGVIAALQFPEPVENRIAIGEAPVTMPLIEVMEHEARHVVALVDREHLRLLAVSFGRVLDELTLAPEPVPAAHDLQAGGYSQKNFQKRKAEETRHFLKDFAEELGDFAARHAPTGLVLLGTDENVAHFMGHLPQPLADRVAYTAHVPGAGSHAEVLERLAPFFEESARKEVADALELLAERVPQSHFAVGGVQAVLDQLRQGKVETLVVQRGLRRTGVQCTQCDVLLDREGGSCPYCGSETRGGVDLVEAMVRQAAAQDARVLFTPAGDVDRFEGAGALLRF
ncbi:MAG TPA: Vms1/Ankzf1 family peptidyl-tRNA hydrolase [Longimicrobiales bacterium]|nr:Vms1/Ankzf1 family peptidyl-tRNA hydrolase [Longimicrobiales bacterium]